MTDCEGAALAESDLVESELIYSQSPMPMPSDADGVCAPDADPDAPPGSLSVAIPVTDTAVILNLQPGQTYFARIRVSALIAGNWSSWSNQVQFTVPYGKPNVIRLSAGLIQWESAMISSTRILGGKT
ncbi:MAG: fibronectin type III domain-containing protein [Deltaproteobacteria bacterium]|nr:fibronectin type III domain-containing protein [Deltaproteobacteria bacterium]